jgi:hypothetical protein
MLHFPANHVYAVVLQNLPPILFSSLTETSGFKENLPPFPLQLVVPPWDVLIPSSYSLGDKVVDGMRRMSEGGNEQGTGCVHGGNVFVPP